MIWKTVIPEVYFQLHLWGVHRRNGVDWGLHGRPNLPGAVSLSPPTTKEVFIPTWNLRLRQLSSWSSTGAPRRGPSASRPSSTTSSRCTSWSWRGSWCRRTSATTSSPLATRTGPPTHIPPRVLTQPTLTQHIQECKTSTDLFQINIQMCCIIHVSFTNKVKSDLPAKLWRLVGCTKMFSI